MTQNNANVSVIFGDSQNLRGLLSHRFLGRTGPLPPSGERHLTLFSRYLNANVASSPLPWTPSQAVSTSDLKALLTTPYGFNAAGDSAWLVNGGLLVGRMAGATVQYVDYYSPDYIKDPLDFVEASDRPTLPKLQQVDEFLQTQSLFSSNEQQDPSGPYTERDFCFANMTTSAGAHQ